MKQIIIKNLSYRFLKDINLSIKFSSTYSLIGQNGSGKTTFGLILTGIIKTKNIFFDDERVSSKLLQKNTIYLNSNLEVNKNIFEILKDTEFYDKYKLDKIFSKKALSQKDKNLLNVLASIQLNPMILVLDDLKFEYKDSIFKAIKKRKITLINITNNPEETLLLDNIIFIDNKICIDKTKTFYEKNKNVKLPFLIELSRKLKYYSLLDNDIYDMNEMVNILWK